MKDSAIQWTHHTFNPWRGCTKVSPGCTNCYADTLSKRNPKTLGRWGPDGTRVVGTDAYWRQPLAWDRAAAKAGERRRVFCASLADVFEDWPGLLLDTSGNVVHVGDYNLGQNRRATLDDARRRLWDIVEATPNLDWLLLTKRPENIARMVPPSWLRSPRPNVWYGTTVEDQQRADERVPVLCAVPAFLRFLSVEPLLGSVVLTPWLGNIVGYEFRPGVSVAPDALTARRGIGWVIVGGESGGGARPLSIGWVRSIQHQCREACVACFVKQLGARPVVEQYDQTVPLELANGHGGDPDEWPADLRVREFPSVLR